MFSQLCRARPRTLWKQVALETRRSGDPDFNGEDRCQLEHCTFCDYRICCQVSTPPQPSDWETRCPAESDGRVTDNPAYGLSSKNWLEGMDASDIDPQEAATPRSNKMAEEGEPKLTWSVLRHRQLSGDVLLKNCDIKNSHHQAEQRADGHDVALKTRKDRSFPLSLVRPVARDKRQPDARQRPVQRKFQNNPPSGDPLSEIAQVKAEESVQEWLARIGESSHWPDEEKEAKQQQQDQQTWTDEQKDDAKRGILLGASKASPANVPMVVMQCSRLHSHVGRQTSLPMGTLVTALYQESDWLYVQTPHGVEGFVSSANCAPIGNVHSEPAQTSRRPWEPCDFPIQVSRRHHELGARQQQSSYIPARLPEGSATPYVSTVRMKTSFYSDRYLSHTFKSKDSIKTAKTVTDILRSSPETKVYETANL